MLRTLQHLGKRAFDLTVGASLFVLATPIYLATTLLIKAFSRGPVLFTQERIGHHGRPFKIYKFRTMHLGAEAHRLGTVTVQNDPRLFPGASLLRKWKIDELPQLWNILNGTMTLVGPRPTVAADLQRMTPAQRKRHDMKPGLTGLAQISGGAALYWPERIEHDLWYIRHFSLWLDVKILAKTATLVLLGKADSNPVEGDEWGIEWSSSEVLPVEAPVVLSFTAASATSQSEQPAAVSSYSSSKAA